MGLMKQHVKIGKPKKITEKEAKKWFDQNQDQIGGRSFDSIKKDLMNYLSEKNHYTQKMTALEKKLKELKFKPFLTQRFNAPRFDIKTNSYPSKGSKKPKVTIVEFADYQCPHCKNLSLVLQDIYKDMKDQIKLVYVDFPVHPSGISEKIARGAYCADKQKKFWSYNKVAFDSQSSLTNNSPEILAKNLKLNMSKFKDCLNDSTTSKHV